MVLFVTNSDVKFYNAIMTKNDKKCLQIFSFAVIFPKKSIEK